MKVDFARELALKILYQVEEKNGYSNLVLDEYLEKEREKLSVKDINLISEIVYGTVSWKLTLDSIIQKYSKIKLNKISDWVRMILRIGIYQIIFLDKIPKSAAVNESVNLCKKYGYKSVSFVNAILRKVEKSDYEKLEKIEDDFERVSKMYSMPKWIVEKLISQYGIPKTEEICKNSNLKPQITIRMNSLKTTMLQLEEELEKRKIIYKKAELLNFLHLKHVKNISKLDLFQNGFFTIQDEGAGEIGVILNPKPGEKILDACSAPGGKTTHLAEIMKNEGSIIAWDIHAHRIKLVEENATRLGISIIKTEEKNALEYDSKYEEMFDKILLDVPCMGIGVLRRKPDIKWQKKEDDIKNIQGIQESILRTCIHYLKNNGELVYSTCSILQDENEEVIANVLKDLKVKKNGRKSTFEIIEKKTILPDEKNDGFFICKIKKKNV